MKTAVILASFLVAIPALAQEPANTAATEEGPAKTGSTESTPSKSDAATSATGDTISKTMSADSPAASPGHYKFSGKSTVTDANGQPAQASLDISTTFLTPQIGWRWVWTSGFFTGVDLGWQLPLNYTSTLNVPAGASPGTIKDIRDNADKYVKSGLPSLGLLELGWFL